MDRDKRGGEPGARGGAAAGNVTAAKGRGSNGAIHRALMVCGEAGLFVKAGPPMVR